MDWLTSHFVVTSDRIIHRRGFIAKYSMEVPLEAINDVRFEQGVIDRIIGAGTSWCSPHPRRAVRCSITSASLKRSRRRPSPGELNQQRMMHASDGRSSQSSTSELERLADLRARGVLTEEEFQAQKRRLLG